MTERPVIVVGVDSTPASAAAVAWAAREADSIGASLRIVHAWHSQAMYGSPFFINVVPEMVVEPERSARDDIETSRDAVLAQYPSMAVESLMPAGPAALTLLENAKDADLLVIGGHHRSALNRAVFGSVTTHAATHARCPVVVVRAGSREALAPGRVVAGFDRSEPSRDAARFAFEYARRHGLEVQVVDACHLPPGADTGHGEDNMLELYRETLPDAISGVAKDFPDVTMTEVVEYGHPALVLLERARDAELLVVGSRGLGHFEGMLMGSVSASLVHESPVSVAVVR